MGICTSHINKNTNHHHLTTIKVIHFNGTLQEHRHPATAADALSHHHSGFFLCSAESMYVGSATPPLPSLEELHPGQIYFLLPQSFSRAKLSLHDLCGLAIKASIALNQSCCDVSTNTSCMLQTRFSRKSIGLILRAGRVKVA